MFILESGVLPFLGAYKNNSSIWECLYISDEKWHFNKITFLIQEKKWSNGLICVFLDFL